MKPGFLYQLMNVFGGNKPTIVRHWGPALFEEPKRTGPQHDRPSPFRRTRSSWSQSERDAVWAKAQPILGWDPNDWRVDHRGNALFRPHYGDAGSAFGWEIGHIVDRLRGGSDDISNLRPQRCGLEAAEAARRFGTPLNLDPFGR